MDKKLLELVACPGCRGALSINAEGGDIAAGVVKCSACGAEYPVINGLPFLYSEAIKGFVMESAGLTSATVRKMAEAGDLGLTVTLANIDYHNKAAEAYEGDSSTAGMFEEGRGSQVRLKGVIEELARRTGGGLFVDIGCGTGNVLKYAVGCFKNVVGVDVSTGMLAISQKRGFQVVLGDALSLPLPDNSADAVSAFSVLHHFADPSGIFKEAYRVLKPGGYLYTDWDPNRKHVIITDPESQSGVFKAAKAVKDAIANKGTDIQASSDDMKAVSELAEYHHHFTKGLDPHELAANIKGQGFSEARVYFHDNCDDLFEDAPPSGSRKVKMLARKVLNMDLTGFDEEAMFPYFALLGKK